MCLCPLSVFSQTTNCKKVYDAAVASAEASYQEAVKSIQKTARLNNMNVNKVLFDLRKQHNQALDEHRKRYDDCIAQANEEERRRRQAKEQADRQNARRIEEQRNQFRKNSELDQFHSKSFDEQRRTLLNASPDALEGSADGLEKRAREIRNQADDARRRGDRATANALDDAASELRSQAYTARGLASRATLEQQNHQQQQRALADQENAKQVDQIRERVENLLEEERKQQRNGTAAWGSPDSLRQKARQMEDEIRQARDDAFKARMAGNHRTASALDQLANKASDRARLVESLARDAHSTVARSAGRPSGSAFRDAGSKATELIRDAYEGETGFRTTVPGQGFIQSARDYVEDAEERVEPLIPLAGRAARYVESIGGEIDELLHKAESKPPPQTHSSSTAPNIGPLPKWLGPGAAQPGLPAWAPQPPDPVALDASSQKLSDDFVSDFQPLDDLVSERQRGSRFDATPTAGSRFDTPAIPRGSRFDSVPASKDDPRLLDRLKNWLGMDEPPPAKPTPNPAPARELKNQFNDRRGSRFD